MTTTFARTNVRGRRCDPTTTTRSRSSRARSYTPRSRESGRRRYATSGTEESPRRLAGPAPIRWTRERPAGSRHVVRRAGTGATAAAGGGTVWAGFDGDEDVAAECPDGDSMKRPKIIL